MKKIFSRVFIFLAAVLLFISITVLYSCAKKQDEKIVLVKINGLLCKSGSKTPFTGREKAVVKGKIIEYDVQNGIKQGEMKISYLNGKTQILGQMIKDKNEGHWKYFYENSAMESEGDFKNDLPEGKWTFYFPDGKIRETGNFAAGKREGKWQSFDDSSKSVVVSNYKNGEIAKK